MILRNCLVGSVAALLLGVGAAAIAQDATTMRPAMNQSRLPMSESRLRIICFPI